MIFDSGQINQQMGYFLGYLPLGLIGFWRWLVWIFKKIISFFYKNPTGKYRASVSLVTPVYNENPEMFFRALLSWKKNKVKEIIAVIDYSDKNCIEIFEKFSQKFSGAKLIVTERPGKRSALADGIKMANGKLIALVDSDTIWTDGFLEKVVKVFGEKKVGGVAPRQDVMDADTLAKKLFRIHIFNRYENDLIYQAAFGDALSCISGRTGIYRAKAIKGLTDELENEFFLGKKCISGDDKRLTNLVQRDGWKVRYVREALVYTPGFSDIKTYLKQQIRWTRNSWRSDISSIKESWLWLNPFLAFHVLDRFVQPFTLLLGPIFLTIAIYNGNWIFISILLSWWLFSRSIKIINHLKKHKEDFLIMPAYIFYSYVIAVIKIYTLVTVGEQSWITRWDKNRLDQSSWRKKWLAYATTFSIISILFLSSFSAHFYLKEGEMFFKKEEDFKKRNTFFLGEKGLFLVPGLRQQEKEIKKIENKINKNSYGYYEIMPFETIERVRKRFLLRRDVSFYDQNGKVLNDNDKLAIGSLISIRTEDLNKTDIDYYRRNSRVEARITHNLKENAIHIQGSGSFITIPELKFKLKNDNFLVESEKGIWLLKKNLLIGDGVTLIIDGNDVNWLKLMSQDDKFIWVRSENGNILINDTKVTSWDTDINDYDNNHENGRSYLLQKSNGRMEIKNSELAYLGYFGHPNRGNPYGGPYGVSWKIKNGFFGKELATGFIKGSLIHNNLFGIYTFGVTGVYFGDNEIYDNLEYGIDPHDDSSYMLIENNQVHNNGNHGIIASKRCFFNIIRGNYSYDNKLHGIMLDRDSNNNLVEDNISSGNINGIALYHSSENIIRNNFLEKNKIGIRGNNASSGNQFLRNEIKDNEKGIYLYGSSSWNFSSRNNFSGNKTNIHLKDKSLNYYN